MAHRSNVALPLSCTDEVVFKGRLSQTLEKDQLISKVLRLGAASVSFETNFSLAMIRVWRAATETSRENVKQCAIVRLIQRHLWTDLQNLYELVNQ